jgi:hypothetical protein
MKRSSDNNNNTDHRQQAEASSMMNSPNRNSEQYQQRRGETGDSSTTTNQQPLPQQQLQEQEWLSQLIRSSFLSQGDGQQTQQQMVREDTRIVSIPGWSTQNEMMRSPSLSPGTLNTNRGMQANRSSGLNQQLPNIPALAGLQASIGDGMFSALSSTILSNKGLENPIQLMGGKRRTTVAEEKDPAASISAMPAAISAIRPIIPRRVLDPVDMNLTFPVKLHMMLSDSAYTKFIQWSSHGRAWRILKPKEFEKDVIPKFFRSAKYASFMRQVCCMLYINNIIPVSLQLDQDVAYSHFLCHRSLLTLLLR